MANNVTEEKNAAEMLGDLVSGFFTSDVFAKTRKSKPGSAPPPPAMCRDILTKQLQQPLPVRTRKNSTQKMTKEQRIKMEADLMGGGAKAPASAPTSERFVASPNSTKLKLSEALVRSPEGEDFPLVQSSSGRWDHSESPDRKVSTSPDQELSLSISPGDLLADQELDTIPANDSHSPSPEIEHEQTRSRSSSCEVPVVVRHRAKSKEERQAEEQTLMQEFRRRELSTWLHSNSSGELTGADDIVDFVPYRPYVKMR